MDLDQKNYEFSIKHVGHFVQKGAFGIAENHFINAMRMCYRKMNPTTDICDENRFIAEQRREWAALRPKLEACLSPKYECVYCGNLFEAQELRTIYNNHKVCAFCQDNPHYHD